MTVSTAAITFADVPHDKVTLVGDCGVGKTTLFLWFKERRFIEDVKSVRHDGELQKRWEIEGNQVSITLFDTVGLECNKHRPSVSAIYFRRAKIIMLVYDITNRETFDNLVHWDRQAMEKTATRQQGDVITVLVGNKIDLEDEREITQQRVQQFADNNVIDHTFEVSAKTGEGVREMFDNIAKIISRIEERPKRPLSRPGRCSKC